jgi:hypothetical protein
MPSDVNPFEPWRPRGTGGGSGGEEVYPWRTPPQDQGPDDDDRNVPYYQRRRKGSGDDLDEDRPVPPPSGANAFSVLLLIVLVISTLVASGINGGGHFWRFAACGVALWFGFFLGASLMYRFGWLSRVGTVLAGMVAAVLCFMFLPTTGGLSWWEARNRLVGLENLPPGDLQAFQAGTLGRSELLREFPAWKRDLSNAEAHWALRTARKVVAESRDLSRSDARKAMAEVEAAERAISATPTGGNYQMELRAALEHARDARLKEIEAAAYALADQLKYPQAHKLLQTEGAELEAHVAARPNAHAVTDQLREIRGTLFNRQLKDAEELLRSLLEKKRYKDVQGEGRRLTADLEEVGVTLGRKHEVKDRLLSHRRTAFDHRRAALHRTVKDLLDRNDQAGASKTITEGLADLKDEARDVGAEDTIKFDKRTLEGRVVSARIAEAAGAAERLIDKKDYAAVPAKAEAVKKELSAEVRAAGKEAELNNRLNAIRTRAWRARLDQSREALRGLLVKDAFNAVGPLGEETTKQLDGEAGLLGLRMELAEFTSRCRAIAKLAEAASKKD